MDKWLETDWSRMFLPQMSLPEIVIRSTLVYLSIVFAFRIVLKRQAGMVSLSDLLVVSIVAGISRNPLIGNAYSITDGILVMAMVLAWSYFLDWLCFYVPFIHELLHP